MAAFNNPCGVAVDGTSVYVADYNNHRIRKIRRSDGYTETLAGDGTNGFLEGTGPSARFSYPTSVAIDSSGNLYVADSGNCRIRKILPNRTTMTLAGSMCAFADGDATTARFFSPTGVAVDASGNVYVADSENHRIRKVRADGNTTTLSGSGTDGFMDGPGASARFSTPTGVAVDSNGIVYVADQGNHRVRKIAADGTTSTLAGGANAALADGSGPVARFNGPYALTVSPSGDLYIADTMNDRVRKVRPDGTTTTLGSASARRPRGVTVILDQLFYASSADNSINKVECAP
jgi:sugar lactone lactonase YvrE